VGSNPGRRRIFLTFKLAGSSPQRDILFGIEGSRGNPFKLRATHVLSAFRQAIDCQVNPHEARIVVIINIVNGWHVIHLCHIDISSLRVACALALKLQFFQ
jgi:hypothetical protein